MRKLVWLVVLLSGCAVGVDTSNETPVSQNTDRTYDYPSDPQGGSKCPPPVTVTYTDRDGNRVTYTYIPPCADSTMNSPHPSDPPGWGDPNGNDNQNDYGSGLNPTINKPQPGDPVPRFR